jgi:FdhD protein
MTEDTNLTEATGMTEKLAVTRLTPRGGSDAVVQVAREYMATVFLNGKELATLVCSPRELEYLSYGFLVSEGVIGGLDEIKTIDVDETRGVITITTDEATAARARYFSPRLITSGCGGNATFYHVDDAALPRIESKLTVAPKQLFRLAKEFQHSSETYLATHGVHSAALCDAGGFLAFSEDIGRHNAIDKLFGKCLAQGIPTEDRLVLTSGRVALEILHKVVRRGIPVLVSVASPISLGVKLAEALGMTLVGSARGGKMNVYTHGWRIDGRKR